MNSNGNNKKEIESGKLLTEEAAQLLENIRTVPIESDEDLSALADIYDEDE